MASPEDSAREDRRRRWRPLSFFLLITLGVGAAASTISEPALSSGWYAGLRRPAGAPPDWLLAPAWTALYGVMAVAAWRAWRRGGNRHGPMSAFAVQLGLTLIWNILFFGLHQMTFALAALAGLNAALLATLILFWRRDRIAGLLMALPLGWNIHAALMGWQLLRLNG